MGKFVSFPGCCKAVLGMFLVYCNYYLEIFYLKKNQLERLFLKSVRLSTGYMFCFRLFVFMAQQSHVCYIVSVKCVLEIASVLSVKMFHELTVYLIDSGSI